MNNQFSRRDFIRIAKTYGLTSAMYGVLGVAGTLSAGSVARAAALTSEARKKKAKYKLKFGGAGFNAENVKIEGSGQIWFSRELERRTNGEIQIDFIGNNQICTELDCVKKSQQGIIDFFTGSTQNAASTAPFYNVLDFAYMFPSRASLHHFFYSQKSEKLLREPLRRIHNIQFLYTHCELRGIMLGLKFKDSPLIGKISELAGTKNRVTGSQMGYIAMKLMDLGPVPLAWEETVDGLKTGLIDGAETGLVSAAWGGLTPVLAQAVDLAFFPGLEQTAMNNKLFEKLPGGMQDTILETAYDAQQYTQRATEDSIINIVGGVQNPQSDTLFAKFGVRYAAISQAEREIAEKMCGPKFNPKPWAQWRERLNKMQGSGADLYDSIYSVAHEIPPETQVKDVKPQRWWKES